MAKLRMLKTSPQKLNLLAQLIRGKKVERALNRADLLEEAHRARREEMPAVGRRKRREQPWPGRRRACRRRGLGRARTWCSRAGRPRARGPLRRIQKPFSELTIKVRQSRGDCLDGTQGPTPIRHAPCRSNRTWDSRWYADTKEYGKLLLEDLKIREFIKEEAKQSGVSRSDHRAPAPQVPGDDPQPRVRA